MCRWRRRLLACRVVNGVAAARELLECEHVHEHYYMYMLLACACGRQAWGVGPHRPVIGATLSKASHTTALRKLFGTPSMTDDWSACRSRISTKTAFEANDSSSAAKADIQ